jgi:hypothetical protein
MYSKNIINEIHRIATGPTTSLFISKFYFRYINHLQFYLDYNDKKLKKIIYLYSNSNKYNIIHFTNI